MSGERQLLAGGYGRAANSIRGRPALRYQATIPLPMTGAGTQAEALCVEWAR